MGKAFWRGFRRGWEQTRWMNYVLAVWLPGAFAVLALDHCLFGSEQQPFSDPQNPLTVALLVLAGALAVFYGMARAAHR